MPSLVKRAETFAVNTSNQLARDLVMELRARIVALETERPERHDARTRLRAWISDRMQGGCRMFSDGDACLCPLCDLDRL